MFEFRNFPTTNAPVGRAGEDASNILQDFRQFHSKWLNRGCPRSGLIGQAQTLVWEQVFTHRRHRTKDEIIE